MCRYLQSRHTVLIRVFSTHFSFVFLEVGVRRSRTSWRARMDSNSLVVWSDQIICVHSDTALRWQGPATLMAFFLRVTRARPLQRSALLRLSTPPFSFAQNPVLQLSLDDMARLLSALALPWNVARAVHSSPVLTCAARGLSCLHATSEFDFAAVPDPHTPFRPLPTPTALLYALQDGRTAGPRS